MTINISENRYYTYIYLDPRKFPPEPFYVGKGVNDRYKSHLRDARNNVKHPKVRKIQAIWNSNLEPIIEIVDKNLSEETALELEDFLASLIGSNFVEEYKNGPLTNMTECGKLGGRNNGKQNGMYGKTHSNEVKQKLSKTNRNTVNIIDIRTNEHKRVSRGDWMTFDYYVASSKGRTYKKEPSTPEAIKNMCIAQQKYHKENPRKWMNKNKENKMIKIQKINQHLENGWKMGRYNDFHPSTIIDKNWLENELSFRSIQDIATDSEYGLGVLRRNMKKYNLKNYTNTKYYNLYHKNIGLLSENLSRAEIVKISGSLLRLKDNAYLGQNVNSKGELKKRFAIHLVGLYVKLIKN